jgi:hypothetical protein
VGELEAFENKRTPKHLIVKNKKGKETGELNVEIEWDSKGADIFAKAAAAAGVSGKPTPEQPETETGTGAAAVIAGAAAATATTPEKDQEEKKKQRETARAKALEENKADRGLVLLLWFMG